MATAADLDACFQLWRERGLLLQQLDPRQPLMDREDWLGRARAWLEDPGCAIFVAETARDELVGYAVVKLEARSSQPAIGFLAQMALDLHRPLPGLSKSLLDRVKDWLRERRVDCLELESPPRYPVEAAFWRAQGATRTGRRLRLKL